MYIMLISQFLVWCLINTTSSVLNRTYYHQKIDSSFLKSKSQIIWEILLWYDHALMGSINELKPRNKWSESKLYILCGSPKCLFSNLKLYKLCKYMFVRHALLVINCCTGSRQQNSSTITDWQNNNKESNAAA